MVIATSTITGFKNQVSEKVYGFLGHIHINGFDFNYSESYENLPINKNQNFYPSIANSDEIKHIQVYATKPGIIKANDQIEGVVLKGVAEDFNWHFFDQYVQEGSAFQVKEDSLSPYVMISSTTANRLNLLVGDKMLVYFIQGNKQPRPRKFLIKGIYNTGLQEFDEIFALVDMKHIQKLNDWSDNLIGGFEIFVEDIDDLEETANFVYDNIIDINLDAKTVQEINPNIFDWLELQNVNQRLILILMLFVAVINIITVLLILILERTRMIGILKALGLSNWSIRKIFIYNMGYIILLGLFWGNLVGIGLSVLQQQFELIRLDEASYYLSSVPVNLNWLNILLINLVVLLVNVAVLIFPSYLIAKIEPIKAVRFT